MNYPDDQELTEFGQAFEHKGSRVLLIACGAIAREVLSIIRANRWEHLDLQCLPAIFHNSPDKIAPAVSEIVSRNVGRYQEIFVLYADCGTGGRLLDLCKELGVKMLSGPHCYSFFEGNDTFSRHSEDEITSFYLTDFLVRQFDAFVIRPLGLDRHPELRDMYFGNYTKLVYQAQTDDPELDRKARLAAERLGLAYERRKTGYGDLEREMSGWISGTQAT